MAFRVQGGTVRESFVLVLDDMDGDGDNLTLPVTIERRKPNGEVYSVELSWRDKQVAIPPEYLLAVAEFVKSKLP